MTSYIRQKDLENTKIITTLPITELERKQFRGVEGSYYALTNALYNMLSKASDDYNRVIDDYWDLAAQKFGFHDMDDLSMQGFKLIAQHSKGVFELRKKIEEE